VTAGTAAGGESGDGSSAPAQDGDFAHRMPTSAEGRDMDADGGQVRARRAAARPGEYIPHDPRQTPPPIDPAETRGKDWALRNKPGRSVPVRRTISVVVREDQIAILPDGAPGDTIPPNGQIVPMKGDTIESLDEFVKEVRSHIDGWGIAGGGLYWRPVLVLNVGPDGERRANDLARLLKNSGLELNRGGVASNPPQGETR
jgi:hypothetical protein